MKIGIYCTVSNKEFDLALATLKFAASSEYVVKIAILITDGKPSAPWSISEKITVYSQCFGAGYSVAIADGGYNQIAARNFLIEKLTATNIDWLLMHDADDLYDLDYYRYISEECRKMDAVTCSCFSLRPGPEICVPSEKTKNIMGVALCDPHTRIWKRSLGLKYQKSVGIEKHFANHSRHCGVIFPDGINISFATGLYHFHLHALLNKRHSDKILSYSTYNCALPESIGYFLERNNWLFP